MSRTNLFLIIIGGVIFSFIVGVSLRFFTTSNETSQPTKDGWETFINANQDLRFRYPTEWSVKITGPDAIRLSNAENVIQIFVDRNPSPSDLETALKCPDFGESMLLDCKDVIIKGRTYKRMLHQASSIKILTVITVTDSETVYMGVGTVPDGDKQGNALDEIETIFATLEVTPSSSSSKSTTPSSQDQSSVVDCGNDTNCFIDRARECRLTRGAFVSEETIFGAKITHTHLWEVNGIESGKCSFSFQRIKSDVTSPEGIIEELSTEGFSGICNLVTNDLVNALIKWQQEKRLSSDFNNENCSGALFDG